MPPTVEDATNRKLWKDGVRLPIQPEAEGYEGSSTAEDSALNLIPRPPKKEVVLDPVLRREISKEQSDKFASFAQVPLTRDYSDHSAYVTADDLQQVQDMVVFGTGKTIENLALGAEKIKQDRQKQLGKIAAEESYWTLKKQREEAFPHILKFVEEVLRKESVITRENSAMSPEEIDRVVCSWGEVNKPHKYSFKHLVEDCAHEFRNTPKFDEAEKARIRQTLHSETLIRFFYCRECSCSRPIGGDVRIFPRK